MFGSRSYHSWYWDNLLFGLATTSSEELVICSSIVVAANSVHFAIGRMALVFILVYSFSIIKQKFYNFNIKSILNHFCS